MKSIDDWNDDIKKRGGCRLPEPTNHPDERMHLTVRDMALKKDVPPEDKVYNRGDTPMFWGENWEWPGQ